MRSFFSILFCLLVLGYSSIGSVALWFAADVPSVLKQKEARGHEPAVELVSEKPYPCADHECGCTFESCKTSCCCVNHHAVFNEKKDMPFKLSDKTYLSGNKGNLKKKENRFSYLQNLICKKNAKEESVLGFDRVPFFGVLGSVNFKFSMNWLPVSYIDTFVGRLFINSVKPPLKPPCLSI